MQYDFKISIRCSNIEMSKFNNHHNHYVYGRTLTKLFNLHNSSKSIMSVAAKLPNSQYGHFKYNNSGKNTSPSR